MIIKSMSRKEATFAQLYDYITREGDFDKRFSYSQNFILQDRDNILSEFERNAALLPKRKNGNYLYHEVISITRAKGLSELEQKERLQDIITQYSQSRGSDCLVFGGLHDEKDSNLHYHLIISANKLEQQRRYRLTKASFDTIKKQTEIYALERYPELEQKKLISKNSAYKNNREKLTRAIEAELSQSATADEFYSNLKKAGYSHRVRGKTHTFVIEKTGKRHRIKTLGLEAEYTKFLVNSGMASTPKAKAEKTLKPHDEAVKGKDDSVRKTANEWVAGNFSQREKEARKQKYKKQDKKDASVKDREDQSGFENFTETTNEWFTGDFSTRDARARKQKSKERLDEYLKKNAPREDVKDHEDMRTSEKMKEGADEWVFGDFSARDARQKKAKSDKRQAVYQSKLQKEREKRYVELKKQRSKDKSKSRTKDKSRGR